MPTLDQLEVQTLIRLLGEPHSELRRQRWRRLNRERNARVAAVLRLLGCTPTAGAARTKRRVPEGWRVHEGRSLVAVVSLRRPVRSFEDLGSPITVALRTRLDERLIERLRRHAIVETVQEPCAA